MVLGLWVVLPQLAVSGVVLIAAGVLQAARLARWAGDRTFADRLVLVLHVGYAFVPIGFPAASEERAQRALSGVDIHLLAKLV